MMQTDIEPNRRVERAMLIHAKPGQLIVKNFRRLFVRKITIRDSPIGDRPRDAMHQLPHRSFAAAFVRIRAVGDVAVKIFRDRNLRRERAPRFWHLDVLLLEDDLTAVVCDFRRPFFPFDLLERRTFRVAKTALETQSRRLFRRAFLPANIGAARFIERRRMESGFQLDHGEGKAG